MHAGNQALTACAAGFHMASLWEIYDPSNLKYDTTLGLVHADSGSGPPSGAFNAGQGWIRTGAPGASNVPGVANCQAWSTTSGQGTRASLTAIGGPWAVIEDPCAGESRVWCVEE
jgi:hypothetical protein